MAIGKLKIDVKPKFTFWGWRKTHKAKTVAVNGNTLLITPPKQSYYNEQDLEKALYESYLILHERFKDKH